MKKNCGQNTRCSEENLDATNNKLHWCSTDRSKQGKMTGHKILLSKPHQYAGPDTLDFRGHRSILIKPKERLMKDDTHQNWHLHFKWIWDHPLLTKVWRSLWRLIPKTSMTQFATFRHAEDLNGHIDFMISWQYTCHDDRSKDYWPTPQREGIWTDTHMG